MTQQTRDNHAFDFDTMDYSEVCSANTCMTVTCVYRRTRTSFSYENIEEQGVGRRKPSSGVGAQTRYTTYTKHMRVVRKGYVEESTRRC